jgi:hypothetical protein
MQRSSAWTTGSSPVVTPKRGGARRGRGVDTPDAFQFVMAGLDPAIHEALVSMDHRVEPGGDA